LRTESNAAGQGPGVFVARPLIFILAALAGCATEIPQKEQGLPVVRSLTIYEELVRRDPSKRLVDLRDAIPGIVIDIRYIYLPEGSAVAFIKLSVEASFDAAAVINSILLTAVPKRDPPFTRLFDDR